MVKQTLYRVNQDVGRWLGATQEAEDVRNPDRTELIRVYKDVVIDAHVWSLMLTTVLKVQVSKFVIIDSEGVVDEELMGRFEKRWFRDFVRHTVNSKFWGYSLISLGDIKNDCFTSVTSVRREFIVPERYIVKRDLGNNTSGTDWRERPWSDWTIYVCEDESENLGILHKASPLALWKKNVLAAWSESAELFGMPIRIGKTDITDPRSYSNMDSMLENMGSFAYGIFNTDDIIEFIETGKSDIHKIYKEFIETTNKELSKLFIGQTMTSEDGSSRAQGEVHERVLEVFIDAMKTFTADVVNDQLLPLMRLHNILPEDRTFKYDDTEKLSKKEMFDIVKDLLTTYTISAEWIEEAFSVPVEEKTESSALFDPNSPAKTVMNSVAELYKDFDPNKSCIHA